MNSMNAYGLFTFLDVVLEGWRNCMNICHYWNECIMFGLAVAGVEGGLKGIHVFLLIFPSWTAVMQGGCKYHL